MEKVKTKVRFTSLDVAAMVQNLQRMIGMRATNIYDLNPSTYIIKLAKSEEKALVLIENGVRFHTVDEKTDKKEIPSGFTMKFRKFLRSKRLESIRQVGVERVVVFTFGTEAYTNHLILELYAQGNIILTDSDYKILQCIRSHQFNQKVKTAVGQIYPFEYAANIYLKNIDISKPKIQSLLEQGAQKNQQQITDAQNKKKKKNNQKKQGTKLRDIVFKLIPCLFPAVIDNILIGQKVDPDLTVTQQNLTSIEEASMISFKFLKEFLKSKHVGFLYSKKQLAQKEQKEYFQYSPYKNIKFSQNHSEFKFDTFDSAVSQYYSKYKKSQHQQQQQFEEIAWKKYEQIKKDQESRVKKLQQQQDLSKVKAEYIQKNLQDVEAVIKIIKTMEDNGYSWEAIQRMVLESKKNGDPLANMIHQLNIMKRQVSVLLGDPSSEQQHYELLPVQINIDYNAYTNATMYYENKKKNYQKQLRTKQASEQVLKIAEKDALKIIQRKKNEQFSKSIPTRKQFWFEKFYWFISSQGILVISGRDSHQNELLVKRYMKAGDLYMHSDYGGAASTVIKVNSKQLGAPRATLEQAAVFTVCRSKAWDTKILSGAWWVYYDQVSKSAPTGQFLPTGSFMIRGKRNFIQPNRMEMGITFLFKIDNQSAKRHMNDRKIHLQQLKQQQLNKTSEQTQNIEGPEQFAIISVETAQKQKGPKNAGKSGNAKQQSQNNPQMKKQQSKKMDVKERQESDQNSNDDDQSEDEKAQNKGKNTKNQTKQQKKKIQDNQQQNQPKQKMRNKRKLKKLQKYLEEQDQQQRQIIMKMIGAREMKHRQQNDQQEQQKQQKGKGKNKNKKKGIDKYIGSQKGQTQGKPNPDKVLFLKPKQDKNKSSSSQQQIKQQQKKEQVPNKEQIHTEEIKEKEIEKQAQQNEENSSDQSNQSQKKQNQNQQKPPAQQTKKQEQEQIDEKTLDSQLAELFKLVGKVHPEDKIENLVTMCAPYNSIKDNRFKIKLVPGGLKKGKAARNILHYFVSSSDLNETEKPLVKSVPEQQIINAIIGNVKLAGAGLLKLEQKEKAQKKTKRKQTQKKQRNG